MNAGISVDLRSATPPYEQIRSQISSLIATGTLTAGSRLPTVRSLASDLGIAAGTVARAYKELEAAGFIESRRRNGTVVAQPAPGGAQQAGGRRPAGRRAGSGSGDCRRRPSGQCRARRPAHR